MKLKMISRKVTVTLIWIVKSRIYQFVEYCFDIWPIYRERVLANILPISHT